MAKTIRDVARHAGVSISTVSRVLNGTAQVNENKRLRVEQAIQELSFIPNQAARSLVQKKTNGIGVLLPSLGGEFFSEFLSGIDVATRESGYHVLISASHGSLEELKVALMSMHQRVDGLIIMSPENEGHEIQKLVADDVPVISINGRASNAAIDTINFDNSRGASMGTEFLIRQGHRRIAFLKGLEGAHDGKQRLQAFRDTLFKHGIVPDPALELQGDFSHQGGYQAAYELMKLTPMPTAVFCANDQSAMGLMAAFQNAGKTIPQDISVIGFDDIPGAQLSAPPLTTINVGIRELGIVAIQRLLEKDSSSSPVHHMLPVKLVERASTTPLVS